MSIRIKQKTAKSNQESQMADVAAQANACPKDGDGNCLVSGVYSDSAPVGGG